MWTTPVFLPKIPLFTKQKEVSLSVDNPFFAVDNFVCILWTSGQAHVRGYEGIRNNYTKTVNKYKK